MMAFYESVVICDSSHGHYYSEKKFSSYYENTTCIHSASEAYQ
jgi:hypothetical protein